jgi:predicted Fe-S protein YdhL (DUF1289 family)
MAAIHITDIEAAINHWREKSAVTRRRHAGPELRALAEVYALMMYYHEDEADEEGFPAQGLCRLDGLVRHHARHALHCDLLHQPGRRLVQGLRAQFDEVQHWPEMARRKKRQVWRRITLQSEAWRFNRYAERAVEGRGERRPGCCA